MSSFTQEDILDVAREVSKLYNEIYSAIMKTGNNNIIDKNMESSLKVYPPGEYEHIFDKLPWIEDAEVTDDAEKIFLKQYQGSWFEYNIEYEYDEDGSILEIQLRIRSLTTTLVKESWGSLGPTSFGNTLYVFIKPTKNGVEILTIRDVDDADEIDIREPIKLSASTKEELTEELLNYLLEDLASDLVPPQYIMSDEEELVENKIKDLLMRTKEKLIRNK